MFRCDCGQCQPMPRAVECRCCAHINKLSVKVSELREEGADIACITAHPGFVDNCLSPWVLSASWYTYDKRDRRGAPPDQHKYVKCYHIMLMLGSIRVHFITLKFNSLK